jgi:hypothetical protein
MDHLPSRWLRVFRADRGLGTRVFAFWGSRSRKTAAGTFFAEMDVIPAGFRYNFWNSRALQHLLTRRPKGGMSCNRLVFLE